MCLRLRLCVCARVRERVCSTLQVVYGFQAQNMNKVAELSKRSICDRSRIITEYDFHGAPPFHLAHNPSAVPVPPRTAPLFDIPLLLTVIPDEVHDASWNLTDSWKCIICLGDWNFPDRDPTPTFFICSDPCFSVLRLHREHLATVDDAAKARNLLAFGVPFDSHEIRLLITDSAVYSHLRIAASSITDAKHEPCAQDGLFFTSACDDGDRAVCVSGTFVPTLVKTRGRLERQYGDFFEQRRAHCERRLMPFRYHGDGAHFVGFIIINDHLAKANVEDLSLPGRLIGTPPRPIEGAANVYLADRSTDINLATFIKTFHFIPSAFLAFHADRDIEAGEELLRPEPFDYDGNNEEDDDDEDISGSNEEDDEEDISSFLQ